MATFNKKTNNPRVIPNPKGSNPLIDPLSPKGKSINLPIQEQNNSFVPGQSVQPGSISMPSGDYHFATGISPESVWAPHAQMGYTLDYIYALLNNSNKGGSLSQGYADVLQQIIYDLQNNPKADINPDLVISLFQNLLSYQTTQEQRGYDYGMKQEQRLYDNPQNELARLMGAGISRDAAIQMLSSNSGSGAGASSAQTAIQSPVAGAGAANLNASNAHSNLIGNIYNGVQLVSNLMQQGFGIAQAIQQTEMLSLQNYMSSQQIEAYNGVNAITQAFNNAITDGVLSIDDVQGLRTADDYYKWIIDHADTNLVKPLIQNGAVRSAFGSSIGRGMMNRHLEESRLGRDSASLFDNYLRQNELDNDLRDISLAQQRRDYYVSFSTTLQDILAKDASLALLYQQYLNGEKIIEINGQQIDLNKYQIKAAERSNAQEQAYFDAFQNALDSETTVNLDGRAVSMSGQDILNYNAFSNLIRSFQEHRALTGLHGVEVSAPDGGKRVVSARERYGEMLDANIMVAITGAFLQDCINNNRLQGYNGSLAPIYKFCDMWNSSGLGQVCQSVGSLVPNINANQYSTNNYFKH